MARRGGARTPNEQTTPFVPPTNIPEDGSSGGPSPSSMYETFGRGGRGVRGGGGGGAMRRGADALQHGQGGQGFPPAGYPPGGFPPAGYPPPGFPGGFPPQQGPYPPHPPPHPYYPTPPVGFTPFPGYFPYPPAPFTGPGGYPPPMPPGGGGGGGGGGRDGRGRGDRDFRGPPPPPQPGPHSHPMPYGAFGSPYGPGYPYPYPSPVPGMPPMPGMPGMYPGQDFDVPPNPPVRIPTVSEMRIDKWTPGPSYGPVLSPFQLSLLGIPLEVNPLLKPSTEQSSAHLEYNVLLPTNSAHRSDDPPDMSWARGRNEPATLPRVSEMRLISKKYPWVIDIQASRTDEGVTCIEVVQALHRDAALNVKRKVYDALPNRSKALVSKQYTHNRTTSRNAPGGAFDSGLKRGDFMLEFIMFNGLVDDQQLVADRFKVSGAGWNGLKERDPRKMRTYPATLVFNLDHVLMSDSVSVLGPITDNPNDSESINETEESESFERHEQ